MQIVRLVALDELYKTAYLDWRNKRPIELGWLKYRADYLIDGFKQKHFQQSYS